MTTLVVIIVMVAVYKTVRWLGSIWISGAEAYDDSE